MSYYQAVRGFFRRLRGDRGDAGQGTTTDDACGEISLGTAREVTVTEEDGSTHTLGPSSFNLTLSNFSQRNLDAAIRETAIPPARGGQIQIPDIAFEVSDEDQNIDHQAVREYAREQIAHRINLSYEGTGAIELVDRTTHTGRDTMVIPPELVLPDEIYGQPLAGTEVDRDIMTREHVFLGMYSGTTIEVRTPYDISDIPSAGEVDYSTLASIKTMVAQYMYYLLRPQNHRPLHDNIYQCLRAVVHSYDTEQETVTVSTFANPRTHDVVVRQNLTKHWALIDKTTGDIVWPIEYATNPYPYSHPQIARTKDRQVNVNETKTELEGVTRKRVVRAKH